MSERTTAQVLLKVPCVGGLQLLAAAGVQLHAEPLMGLPLPTKHKGLPWPQGREVPRDRFDPAICVRLPDLTFDDALQTLRLLWLSWCWAQCRACRSARWPSPAHPGWGGSGRLARL